MKGICGVPLFICLRFCQEVLNLIYGPTMLLSVGCLKRACGNTPKIFLKKWWIGAQAQIYVLIARYYKARRFDEDKKIDYQMVNNAFIELSSLEDPLSKAFVVLGLDPLVIRLRRDNDVGLSMAEFFDDLGNGLYLDTDLDEYEKKVSKVLEGSTRPDFNSLIMNEFSSGNFKNAF